MKKIFLNLLAAITIVVAQFVASPAQVLAQDVYCGTYDSGLDAYAMSETIKMGTPGFRRFDIRIKAVDSNGRIIAYVDYHFWNDVAEPVKFSNSQGYSGVVDEYSTPVEYNIWKYAQPISSAQWSQQNRPRN